MGTRQLRRACTPVPLQQHHRRRVVAPRTVVVVVVVGDAAEVGIKIEIVVVVWGVGDEDPASKGG